jgi:hypothetical protein
MQWHELSQVCLIVWCVRGWQIQLSSEDKASMAAGDVVATTTDIGGMDLAISP